MFLAPLASKGVNLAFRSVFYHFDSFPGNSVSVSSFFFFGPFPPVSFSLPSFLPRRLKIGEKNFYRLDRDTILSLYMKYRLSVKHGIKGRERSTHARK